MAIDASITVSPEAIEEFCKRWKIVELGLFGSAARGEMRPDSDVDVMVTFAPDHGWGLYDLVHMQDELTTIFGRDVDILTKKSVRNPIRRRMILRDLLVLYGS